jgi:ketosteroid isomerase-like protein
VDLVRVLALAVSAAMLAAPVATAARSDSPTATKRVVRAWSARLNAYDNAGVARLFARPAVFVQGGSALRLETPGEIARWHSLLPCAGRIVSIDVDGELATAVFLLASGKHRHCDAPGQKAAAVFRVRHGKILAWVQVPVPPPTATGPTA